MNFFLRPANFKRLIATLVFTQLFYLTHHAQISSSRHRENFDVRKFDIKTILIAPPENKITLSGISSITVLDARADTGRIGLMQKKVVGVNSVADGNHDAQRVARKPAFLHVNSGLQKATELFACNYLQLPGKEGLPGIFMVIKKLWLSDELNIDLSQENKRILKTETKESWTSGADIKIEFFLRFGQDYYALCRFDSLINKALTISEYGPEYISLALRASLDKLATMNSKIEAGIGSRRKFSLEEIIKHNEDAYNLPVLTDSTFRTGVYMTFEEFKNNSPSVADYKLKKERLTDFLYVKQAGGNEVVIRDAWGYSDGKNAFIRAGDNYFLLQQIENTFYIVGTKNIQWQRGATIPAAAPVPGVGVAIGTVRYDGYVLHARPFQLDWSTGLLY